jgi:hypothetical protein
MTILFFFLFGCIAGCLLCRQGPQGTPGPPGPQGPQGESGVTAVLNLVHRQRVLESNFKFLEFRMTGRKPL